MSRKIIQVMVLIFTALIVLSFITVDAVTLSDTTSEDGTRIVLVNVSSLNDISGLGNYDMEMIHRYDAAVLVEAGEKELLSMTNAGYRIQELYDRTTIHVRGTTFDRTHGEPDMPHELKVTGYAPGEKGQYIVHTLGPIASGWRTTLEEKDLEIMHYMSKHAYRVRMTPEVAEGVKDLYFVDWVGFYHPYYKLQPGLENGLVEVGMVPGTNWNSINQIHNRNEVLSASELSRGGYRLKVDVGSVQSLYDIANMGDVDYIYRYVESRLSNEIVTQTLGGGLHFFDDEDGDPETAYRKHGDYGSYMNQLGYTGSGVVSALADTGIGDGTTGDAGHADFTGRVIGGHSYGGGLADGYEHGTACAGILGGDTYHGTGYQFYNDYYASVGSAPETEFFSVRIFDNRGGYIGPDDYYDILQVAKQQGGAYVHSNSWGAAHFGAYDHRSSVFDRGARDSDPDTPGNQPMVITVSAGNEGSSDGSSDVSIDVPATGKNVLAIGATETYPENPENVYWMSSRGWTQDNRVKPDLVSPGWNVLAPHTDGGYRYNSGTSFSNPSVAGAAAVVVQWYEENHGYRPSPAMVRALLINTANDLDPVSGNTRGHIPNQDEGWGIVDISKLERPLDDPVPFYLHDESSVFTDSGQVNQHSIMVDNDDIPLKISLVWTDKEAPDGTGGGRALINDLNLEVESPSGSIYRGNAFSGGWTLAGENTMSDFDSSGDGWDDSNNVENVYIHPDEVEPGMYTVRVEAREIADDSVNLGYNSQDYALVAYNALSEVPGDPPEITLLSPQGGEAFTAGDETEIQWDTVQGEDDIDGVSLSYSIDEGESWMILEPWVPDTGDHTWSVPNVHSSDCLLRATVTDTVGRTGEDTSLPFSIEGIPPQPPGELKVEHTGSPELVENGIFDGDHDPWVLTRVQDQGEARWDSECYLEGGSIYVRVEAEGEGTVKAEESYWEQSMRPTTEDISVVGALRKNTFYDSGVGWETRVHRADVELSVRDSGNWETVILNEDISLGDTLWVLSESVVYRPQGTVDAVRIRMHVEAEGDTGIAGGDHSAMAELWVDHISLTVEDAVGTEDNLVSWDASEDDPELVNYYNVYRSESDAGPWTSPIGNVDADGSPDYQYWDAGAGTGDDTIWWYVVRAVGINGLEEDNLEAAPEPGLEIETVDVDLFAHQESDGWNLVSFNIIPLDTSLISILDDPVTGIAGDYDRVMYFDASVNRWRSHLPGRPEHFNNLDRWDRRMGVWIRMNTDTVLTVEGTIPSTTTVPLEPGWNMVGLPSSSSGEHGIPSEITKVGRFHAPAEHNVMYEDVQGFQFEPGQGYWVYNEADYAVIWNVDY